MTIIKLTYDKFICIMNICVPVQIFHSKYLDIAQLSIARYTSTVTFVHSIEIFSILSGHRSYL